LLHPGCKRNSQLTPAATYNKIDQEFIAGNLQAAREHAEEANQRFANDATWTTAFRLELAKILIWQGNNGDALLFLQQPLPSQTNLESQVRQKAFLAIAQARLGHLDQAGQTIVDAEKQCPEGPLRIETDTARGTIEVQLGNFDDAERAFQSALTVARQNANQFLETQALVNLGVVSMQEVHYEDALQRFTDGSNVARLIGAKLLLQKAVGNIGWIYYKTGDFQRSLVNYDEAEKQAVELGVPIDQGLWLNNAGQSEYRLGDLAAARSFYERALGLAQSIQNQKQILDLHVDLGYLLLQLNDVSAAEAHIHEATRLAALRRNNRAELNPMLLEALLLNAKGDRAGATEILLELDKRAAELPTVQWDSESNLARIYADTGKRIEADRWFRRAIDTFQLSRASLTSVDSTLPFLANGRDLYTGYSDYLIQEHKPEKALSVIDESRAESLADGLHLSRTERKGQPSYELNTRAIVARVQATILVYSLRPKASYLWVITPARQQFFQIAGSETILPLVQQHSKMIMESKDLLSQPDTPGRKLYDALVAPAQGLIKKDSRVFIVADDALSGLNFETLQTPGNDSHYWIEDVAITNAKSLQLLSMRAPRQPHYADRRILLMGDPVYRKDEYTELPNAATEVAKIASHFASDRRTVITGPQASPEAYQLAHAGEFSYIHFVAHATANMSSPLDSAVVLSSDHDNATIYKLYARDILKQNLNADLVTVSSCYGSGIRDYSGEGLVGLAWAFLRAGSHHVIGAMWDVSDVSTPMLMDRLYGELANGIQPDEALRTAKLAMIHSNGVFRKPLYWAPFQLYSGA
jgi:CHAT domain-containing protein/Flp pilus assembly protein TadD